MIRRSGQHDRVSGRRRRTDQVIFDGSSFGTATPAGSDEEADYLGILGLLDADSMRDLLRRRQEEQLTKRTASSQTPGRRPTVSCANCAANSMLWWSPCITAPVSRTV